MLFTVLSSGSVLAERNIDQQQHLPAFGQVKICVDPHWMPFESINKQGQYEGMLADYARLIADLADISFVLYPTQSYLESREALKQGLCHLIIGDVATKAVLQDFLTTNPYFISPRAFAIREDTPLVSDFKQLTNRPVGVLLNSPAQDILPEIYPDIRIITFSSTDKGLQSVASGEIIAFVNMIGAISYSLQQQSLTNVKIGGTLSSDVAIAMLVNKQHAPLVDQINAVIPEITQQDRKRIFEKWIAVKFEKGLDWYSFWLIISCIIMLSLSIVIAIFIWNRALKTEIQRRKDAETELRRMAMTDQLTGLANRNQLFEIFDDILNQAQCQQCTLAIAVIDLDDFKPVNDNYGHPAGDILLKEVATRLRHLCKGMDMVARFGGDEFAMLICSASNKKDLEQLGQNIIESLARPVDIGTTNVNVGASIGFSIFPDHGATSDEMISKADLAMYQSKAMGKNTFSIFEASDSALDPEALCH